MTKVAIVYYSSYGSTHAMAQRLAQTAEKQGAEVRLRHVKETAPAEAYGSQEPWKAHVDAMADEPVAAPFLGASLKVAEYSGGTAAASE